MQRVEPLRYSLLFFSWISFSLAKKHFQTTVTSSLTLKVMTLKQANIKCFEKKIRLWFIYLHFVVVV
jgi:hypothetical protein